jgi:spermidine/putrescine transport system permease protein
MRTPRGGGLARLAVGLYLVLFFAYLFGPLVIMSGTAFNSSAFPRLYPWECPTFEWFGRLVADQRLMTGLKNSLVVGAGVVVLSVALGLAGSLLLTQIWPRARSAYYTLVTAPILMPGVVIGISTVLFWDRLAHGLGADYGGAFYNGIFLTILGQSCFIASYCMLVFVARLQRFDLQLMDAALDLGASNAQAFRKILLPFLKPAIFSAAVIAFLASFENYNTSVFTIGHYNSFTIEVAQKVRLGIDPSISALAVIVIVLTLVAALAREAWLRRSERRSGGTRALGGLAGAVAGNPATVLLAFLLVAVAATAALAARHDPAVCKAAALEERLERQRRLEEEARARRPAPPAAPAPTVPGAPPAQELNPGRGTFGDMFTAPGGAPAAPPAPAPAPESRNPGQDAFGGLFTAPGTTSAPGAASAPSTQAPPPD